MTQAPLKNSRVLFAADRRLQTDRWLLLIVVAIAALNLLHKDVPHAKSSTTSPP